MDNSCAPIIVILLLLILGAFFPLLYIFIILALVILAWVWLISGHRNYKEINDLLKEMSIEEIAQVWNNSVSLANDVTQTEQIRSKAKQFIKVIQDNYPTISLVQTHDIPLPSSNELNLHNAIIEILKKAQKPLTISEIAEQINQLDLYRRYNSQPITTNQISARINKYPSLFEKDKSSKPMKISLKQ